MFRLRILRLMIISVFSIFLSVMAILPSWMKKVELVRKAEKLVLPIYWLRHYLLGSGKSIRVPDCIVREAESVFLSTIRWWNEDYRPTLFYLLGGFTFRLYPGYVWDREDREQVESLVVSGNDHYDWHANEDGKYFSSPIGNGKIATVVIKTAAFLFGEKYFLEEGSPHSVTGEMGISNQLWADMKKVGAAEFNSYFCNIEIVPDGFSEEELDRWVFYPDSEENFDVPW